MTMHKARPVLSDETLRFILLAPRSVSTVSLADQLQMNLTRVYNLRRRKEKCALVMYLKLKKEGLL